MAPHVDWVERRFDFGFPAALYPEIVERLRGTPARLADRLLPLPPEVRTRRDGQDWSMQEHAGHLLDLEALFHQRLDNYAAGDPVLHPADMANRRTWEARHNDQPLEALLAAFRRERQRLVERVEALPAEALARVSHHPRLETPMRLVDLLFFQAEHDDYHLARISDLVRRLPGG